MIITNFVILNSEQCIKVLKLRLICILNYCMYNILEFFLHIKCFKNIVKTIDLKLGIVVTLFFLAVSPHGEQYYREEVK